MRTSLDDLSLVLGEVALFRDLPDTVIAEVARAAHVVSLPKGAAIYASGERPKALFHVMSGHLKVAVSSPEGGEKVIEILSPNQLFGVAELFGDSAYVSSVETVSPVVLVSVGRDGIFRAMDSEPRLMRRMLAAVAQRQSAIERDIAADCLQSGSAKVVEYLRRLGTSAVAKAAQIELELAIPKNVLAARMGFTPETLSRIFRELSDAGFIHVLGKHVTLTEKFTRQYACGAERAVAERRPASRGSVWFDRPAAATTAHAAWN